MAALNEDTTQRLRAFVPQLIAGAVVLALLTGCGGSEPDYASNEGAQAWLASHGGAIPEACTIKLIERYGDTQMITTESRAKAKSDALDIAGRVYATALAGDRAIKAAEEVVKVDEEGVAKGFLIPSALEESRGQLFSVMSEADRALKSSMSFMEVCTFDAAHRSLGIAPIRDANCAYDAEFMGDLCRN
jgi:hypothetical protein